MLPEAVRSFLRKRRTRLRSPTVPAILDHGAVPWLLAVALTTTLPHLEHLPAWLSLFMRRDGSEEQIFQPPQRTQP